MKEVVPFQLSRMQGELIFAMITKKRTLGATKSKLLSVCFRSYFQVLLSLMMLKSIENQSKTKKNDLNYDELNFKLATESQEHGDTAMMASTEALITEEKYDYYWRGQDCYPSEEELENQELAYQGRGIGDVADWTELSHRDLAYYAQD